MTIEIVPASAELLRAYYGDREIPTTYAFVWVEEGTPIAVAGLVRMPENYAFIYSDSPRHLNHVYAKQGFKTMRRLLTLADGRGWHVVAQAEEGTEAAPRFLEHFGFEKQPDGEYIRWAR